MRTFASHGGNVVQGQGRGHGFTFGERSIERTSPETRAGSKSLESDARLGQHLRIYVHSFNGPNAFMF